MGRGVISGGDVEDKKTKRIVSKVKRLQGDANETLLSENLKVPYVHSSIDSQKGKSRG